MWVRVFKVRVQVKNKKWKHWEFKTKPRITYLLEETIAKSWPCRVDKLALIHTYTHTHTHTLWACTCLLFQLESMKTRLNCHVSKRILFLWGLKSLLMYGVKAKLIKNLQAHYSYLFLFPDPCQQYVCRIRNSNLSLFLFTSMRHNPDLICRLVSGTRRAIKTVCT